jgi:hypothetical protein
MGIMKKIGEMCIIAIVLVLCNCPSYEPFDLSTGKMTIQEALGYLSDDPYMAVTAESKHYYISDSYRLYDGMSYGANGNEDGILNPGETIIYELKVGNYGKKSVLGVNAVISTNDGYVSNMANTSGNIGNFKERGSYRPDSKTIFAGFDREKNLRFTVSPNTPAGHIIRFEIVFSDANGNTWRDYFLFTVYSP